MVIIVAVTHTAKIFVRILLVDLMVLKYIFLNQFSENLA